MSRMRTTFTECAITPVFYRQGKTDDGKEKLLRAPINVVQVFVSGTSGNMLQAIQPDPMVDASIYTVEVSADLDYIRGGGGYWNGQIVIGEHELGAWNGMSNDGPMWGLHYFGWL